MMNLTVASSPHIRGNFKTRRIMLDVVLALLPALIVGIVMHGVRSLFVCLVSIICCVGFEWLYGIVAKKRCTVVDGSAVVTGILLGMTLPATVPYWLIAAGSAFAIICVKALCGGLGQNIFNPALSARGFMMLIAPAYLVRFEGLDGVTAATPLHHMVMPALPEESLLDMFLGLCPGSIGEVSALALLIGGAYLVIRKVISVRIPLAYLGTVAVLTFLLAKTTVPVDWTLFFSISTIPEALLMIANYFIDSAVWMLYSLLSGGLMLGAIFMATDYASSPVTPRGQVVYGIGCGVLTVLFRYFGLFPEGVTYAILIMNALVWLLDRYAFYRRFGVKKNAKKGEKTA